MDRQDLEDKSREELIVIARPLGVTRAEVLTRAELIDEILRRSIAEPETQVRARGFLGRARDLIARIVEKGLHLPEAAEHIRRSTPPTAPNTPAPVATVTLAEIYAAQGHIDRAIKVLEDILALEPEHLAAKTLHDRLTKGAPEIPAPSSFVDAMPLDPPDPTPTVDTAEMLHAPPVERLKNDIIRPPPTTPEDLPEPESSVGAEPVPDHPTGPVRMLDDEPLPYQYDVDEAVVMPVDPTTAYVYWEVRPATIAQTKAKYPAGQLIVRVFAATDDGVVARDIRTDVAVGDYFVFGLPEGATLQVLLGWDVNGVLQPLAFTPSYSAPPAAPVRHIANTVAEWRPEQSRVLNPRPQTAPPPPALEIAIALAQAASEPVVIASHASQLAQLLFDDSAAHTVLQPWNHEPALIATPSSVPDIQPDAATEPEPPTQPEPVWVEEQPTRTEHRRVWWSRVAAAVGSSDLAWLPLEEVVAEESTVGRFVLPPSKEGRKPAPALLDSSPMGSSGAGAWRLPTTAFLQIYREEYSG